MRTHGDRMGRGTFARFGRGNYIREMPARETLRFGDFSGAFDARDAREDIPPNSSPDAVDVEVDRKDRIIRAPGTTAYEALAPKTPQQIAVHAGLDYRSELVIFDPPFIGFKREAAITWVDVALPNVVDLYFWATYGDYFVFANTVGKVRSHQYGTNAVADQPTIPNGASFASFAGRLLVGGAVLDGNFEPMGLWWTGTNGFNDNNPTTGSGDELLIAEQQVGDRIVALRPMGFDYCAILCRKTVWIARRTGDIFRPVDPAPRDGPGCVHEPTAKSVRGGVMYLSDEGVQLFDGNTSQHVSPQIDPEILPIDTTRIKEYRAGYNPFKQQYVLLVPGVGAYVYDLQHRRWYKRSQLALDVVPFALQFHATTWGEAVGSWGSQGEQTWASTAPKEADVGDMIYLGQKADASWHLEKELYGATSYFGRAQNPRWPLYLPSPADNTLVTYHETRVKHEGSSGSIAIQRPDVDGDLVDSDSLDLATASVVRVRRVPRLSTGKGIALGIRFVSGTPAIAGLEIDIVLRSRKIGIADGAEFMAAPTGLVATVISSSRVDLVWVDNSSIETGYEIWRKAGAGAYGIIFTTAANITAYSDLTVVGPQIYTYKVRAVKT